MPTNCNKDLTADMIYDCADKAKKGLDGGQAILINWDDIDRSGSTVSDATISDLVLKSGKSGFLAEWFKELASANSTFAASTEDVDGFTHNFLCRLQNATAASAERARELAEGRFVVVVETRYKGASDAEAFKVFGWENGVKLSEMTYNTLENSGSFTLYSGN